MIWPFRRRTAPKPLPELIVGRCGDVAEIGEWGVVDQGGRTIDGGAMLGETVKIRQADGSVRLDREWFHDRTL